MLRATWSEKIFVLRLRSQAADSAMEHARTPSRVDNNVKALRERLGRSSFVRLRQLVYGAIRRNGVRTLREQQAHCACSGPSQATYLLWQEIHTEERLAKQLMEQLLLSRFPVPLLLEPHVAEES